MMNVEEMRKKMDHSFFPAVPVPFDKYGTLYEDAHDAYAAYMAGQPVTGVAIWAHTGRGLMLSKEQREFVFRSWRRALPKDKLIVCGVGTKVTDGMTEEQFLQGSLEMGQHAKRLGADALLIYAPAYYRDRAEQDEKIVLYHRKIAELGIPMILFYLYREAGGISYGMEVLEQLFAIENVIGIKMATLDSVMTYQDVSKMILNRFPGIRLITGEDRMYGYTLARGAGGALVGLGAACQKLQRDMMEAFFSQDYSAFVKLMLEVDKLAECTFIHPMEGYIERMLYILSLQGIIPEGAVNDPYGPGVTDAEKEEIRRVLEELKQLR